VSNEINSYKDPTNKEKSGPNKFISEFYQTFKDLTPVAFQTIPKKYKGKG
jgi:hypothetical protein